MVLPLTGQLLVLFLGGRLLSEKSVDPGRNRAGATDLVGPCWNRTEATDKREIRRPKPNLYWIDGFRRPKPNLYWIDGSRRPKPNMVWIDGFRRPKPNLYWIDGSRRPKPNLVWVDSLVDPCRNRTGATGSPIDISRPNPTWLIKRDTSNLE